MPIDTSRLTGALRGLSDRFESKDSVYEAIYVSDNGDGWHYVDVLNPDGTQGVRRLVRGRVRSWPGVLVRLSYHRKAYGPDELVIIGPSELAYGSSPAPSLLEPHGDDHGYNRIDECMTLYTWQIWPLRIQPTSPESLFAHVMPGVYYADGSYRQTVIATDVDLTANLPAVLAWKYVTLSIDGAGAITVTDGTEHGAISVEDIPLPPTGEYPLGAVLLHINDTALFRERFVADLRYILTPTSLSTFIYDITLDDGVGDSPSLCFVGGSNDDTICIYLDDDAVANNSDLVIELCATDADSRLSIRDSTPTEVAYIDADGGAGFVSTVTVGHLGAAAAQLDVEGPTTTRPVLILQTTDDNATNPILEIQDSGGVMLSEIEKDGNLNFVTATAANPGMIEVDDTRFFHTYGTDNIFVGLRAGNFAVTGDRNVALGKDALFALTSGFLNVAIGGNALESNTSGVRNLAIGAVSLRLNTTGDDNVAVGGSALLANISGSNNLAVGQKTLFSNTTGSYNVAIGSRALEDNTTGYRNIGIGGLALFDVTEGFQNTGIGYWAGFNITTGDNNICIGHQAGDVLITGNNNIIIGHDVDPTGAAVSNELNIGDLIYGDLSANIAGVNVTPPNLLATWHVDQPDSGAAIPVLYLDQADVSEEMIQFETTIGVGNAIEAVGAKALTTTHFIKVTLPGGLTRYIPAGTIA